MSKAEVLENNSTENALAALVHAAANGQGARQSGDIANWRAVVAQMPTAMLLAQASSGKIFFYNEIAARLLRLSGGDGHDADSGGDGHDADSGGDLKMPDIYARFFYPNGLPCRPEEHPLLLAGRRGIVTNCEEMLYRDRRGVITFLAVSAAPLRNSQGQTIAVIATFDNISARKQAEQDLHRRYEEALDNLEALQVAQEDLLIMRTQLELERLRYRELFQFATDGYLVTDMRGVILEANLEACAKLNITPDYVKGKIFANYISPEDRVEFRGLLNRMEHERGRVDWEGHLTPRNDGLRDAQFTVAAMRDPDTDEPQVLRWLLRDITARRNLERARLADQQRLLGQEHRAGVMEERTRIAQEFHDTLAQGFTGIAFLLAAAENALPISPEEAGVKISRARQVATQSIVEARQAIRAMRSENLDADNLPAAFAVLIEQIATQTGVHVHLEITGQARLLPAPAANDLLRIGQEAITNAIKHARAGEIRLCLQYEPEQALLRITDDGQGFSLDKPRPEGGFGLTGMRERAQRIGGHLEITAEKGKGTTIAITVPLSHQNS